MKKKLVLSKNTIKTLDIKSNLKTGAGIDDSINAPPPPKAIPTGGPTCSQGGSRNGNAGGGSTAVAQ